MFGIKIKDRTVGTLNQRIGKLSLGAKIGETYRDWTQGSLINTDNTYDFAKKLIEVPVTERLDWLSNKMYDILSHDETATLEEYQDFAEMLNTLY